MPATRDVPETIDDVIAALDDVVVHSRREGDRLGYFAALYRGVTRQVRDRIAARGFEDGERMARLDVIFARRYLDALAAYRAGESVTRAWRAAFDAAPVGSLLVLQHLMLGMNAHINLDLGIAAATTSPGAELPALRRDFDAINAILAAMIDEVQDRIARVSPWMTLIDRVGFRDDEEICSFCIDRARDVAWRSATVLAPLSAGARDAAIVAMDATVALLAAPIRTPPPLTRAALLAVRARESSDVARVIDAMGT
jgi:hypothetical protein